jgi:hypothetical protein
MLSFVQVPVPREHVLEIMRWVLFRTEEDDSARERDRERFTTYLAEADAEARRLLELVATATLEGQPLRLRDLSDLLDQDRPSTQALLEEIDRDALDEGRHLLERQNEPAVGVEGQKGSRVLIGMREDLARLVRSRAVEGGC